MSAAGICSLCHQPAPEVCPDGVCRACHKSVSWEDCCDGTYNARNLLRLGHSPDEVREEYPDARLPNAAQFEAEHDSLVAMLSGDYDGCPRCREHLPPFGLVPPERP